MRSQIEDLKEEHAAEIKSLEERYEREISQYRNTRESDLME